MSLISWGALGIGLEPTEPLGAWLAMGTTFPSRPLGCWPIAMNLMPPPPPERISQHAVGGQLGRFGHALPLMV